MVAERLSISQSAEANLMPWLDALVAGLASGANQEGRPVDTPLDAVLSALERARPHMNRLTEIALYERWIAANLAKSPLLNADWFSIGVSLACACGGV